MKNILLFLSLCLIVTVGLFTACTKETIEKTIEFKYRDTIIYVMDTVRINSRDTVFLGKDSIFVDFVYTINYYSFNVTDSAYADLIYNDNSRNLPSDAKIYFDVNNDIEANYITLKNYIGHFQLRNSGSYILAEKIEIPSLKKIYYISKSFSIKLNPIP